ncbi:MAG: HemK family protein methyltransferase [Lautropia sp.]|nr:HemK family protein methyltransferase [Lautropia sp.]
MNSDKPPFPQTAPFSPYRANYSPQSSSLIDAQEGLCTLRDWVRFTVSRLQAAGASFGHGTDNPFDEAVWLVCWCLHLPVEQYDDLADATLLPSERRKLRNLIDARSQCDQPLAYITGEAWLMGFRFRADPRALVPRSLLAEALVQHAFDPWVKQQTLAPHLMIDMTREPEQANAPPYSVLDLCTGGGSLAIIAAYYLPSEARIVASDLSEQALQQAAENIADYSLESRIELLQGDLFERLENERFNVILCNPPYVNADSMAMLPSEYRAEPEKALGSGQDGMDLISRLLVEAPEHLQQDGILILEIGHEMPNFQARFPTLSWTAIPVTQGDDRVVLITYADLLQWRNNQQDDPY